VSPRTSATLTTAIAAQWSLVVSHLPIVPFLKYMSLSKQICSVLDADTTFNCFPQNCQYTELACWSFMLVKTARPFFVSFTWKNGLCLFSPRYHKSFDGTHTQEGHTFTLLTLWELAYDIFVLRFRPKKQQFSVALPAP